MLVSYAAKFSMAACYHLDLLLCQSLLVMCSVNGVVKPLEGQDAGSFDNIESKLAFLSGAFVHKNLLEYDIGRVNLGKLPPALQ